MRVLLLAAALVPLAALAVAPAAEAAPTTPLCDAFALRSVRAACETVFFSVGIVTAEANCLLNTPPVNWVPACTSGAIGPIPIVGYLLCYYNTPPSAWVATCV